MGDILARRNGGLGAVFGPMAVRGYRVAAESGA